MKPIYCILIDLKYKLNRSKRSNHVAASSTLMHIVNCNVFEIRSFI